MSLEQATDAATNDIVEFNQRMKNLINTEKMNKLINESRKKEDQRKYELDLELKAAADKKRDFVDSKKHILRPIIQALYDTDLGTRLLSFAANQSETIKVSNEDQIKIADIISRHKRRSKGTEQEKEEEEKKIMDLLEPESDEEYEYESDEERGGRRRRKTQKTRRGKKKTRRSRK
jgi:hypothetical protein